MVYDYYLNIKNNRFNNSLAYIIKNYVITILNKHNKTFTTNINDDYLNALFLNGNDFLTEQPTIKKRKIPCGIIAGSDFYDFQAKLKKTKIPFLTQEAYLAYSKADFLYVTDNKIKELLQSKGINSEFKMMDFSKSYDEKDERNIVPDAFHRYISINSNKKLSLIISSYYDNKLLKNIYRIVKNNPEFEYVFIGDGDPESFKKSFMETPTVVTNILFYKSIPEELYISALNETSSLILTGEYIPYPQIIADALTKKIPLIVYQPKPYYPEILNSNTSIYTADLVEILTKIKNQDYVVLSDDKLKELSVE